MKSYLLTGATGFLGKEIYRSLKEDVVTLGRSIHNDIQWDFSSIITGLPKVKMVIHCAGKAHTDPKTTIEKEEMYRVNFLNTIKLVESLKASHAIPNTVVFISSVSVYGQEDGLGINENNPLLGDSPYATSKILAEKKLQIWSEENNVNLIILRLPLIAGNHPPGNLGNMISGIKKGYYFGIRGNLSKKSIILSRDVAELIPLLMNKKGTFNLTDGVHPNINQIEEAISERVNKKLKRLPFGLIKALASVGDIISLFPLNSERFKKLTSSLTFDDSKAIEELKWNPKPVLDFLSKDMEI